MLRCQNTSEKATRPRPSQKESAQLLRLSGEPSGRRVAYNIVTGTSLIFALTARHFPSPYPSSSQSPLCHSTIFLASCPSAPPSVANFESSRLFAGHKHTLYTNSSSSRQYEPRDYSELIIKDRQGVVQSTTICNLKYS